MSDESRVMIAALALSALIQRASTYTALEHVIVAEDAVKYADALLAELNKPPQPQGD